MSPAQNSHSYRIAEPVLSQALDSLFISISGRGESGVAAVFMLPTTCLLLQYNCPSLTSRNTVPLTDDVAPSGLLVSA